MSTLVKVDSLTAADLRDNVHDIQDNVVAPILMRYGRHIFFKFTDGQKARAWLRNMFDRVNARDLYVVADQPLHGVEVVDHHVEHHIHIERAIRIR